MTVQIIRLEPEDNWKDEVLRCNQLEDADIGDLVTLKERNERPSWSQISEKSPMYKSYWAQWDSLKICNGVLYRIWESADGASEVFQKILPRKRIPEVLEEIHGGVPGGHLKTNKMLEKVGRRFYLVNSRADVERWCQAKAREGESRERCGSIMLEPRSKELRWT